MEDGPILTREPHALVYTNRQRPHAIVVTINQNSAKKIILCIKNQFDGKSLRFLRKFYFSLS